MNLFRVAKFELNAAAGMNYGSLKNHSLKLSCFKPSLS